MYDFVIIEPHEDDALFSASSLLFPYHCEFPQLNKLIVTCSVRTKETGRLCQSLGHQSQYIELPDLSWLIRLKDNSLPTWEDYINHYRSIYPHYDQLKLSLEKIFSIDANTFVFPLGMKHPYHVLISSICFELSIGKKSLVYFDFPYCNRKRWEGYIKWRIKDRQIDTVPVEKEKRLKLLKEFYPDQMGLLRFEGDKWLDDRFVDFNTGTM